MLALNEAVFILAIICVAGAAHSLERSRTRQTSHTACYGDLGCFKSHGVVPVPQNPSTVKTTFELYRRGHSRYYSIAAYGFGSHLAGWISHFNSAKSTKVLIHGFLDDGHKEWVPRMVGELLKKGDFNVIVVNWGHGAKTLYEQAVANTFLVGAELAQFLTHLHDHNGLNYNMVHLIGHSLGAQVAGHTGRQIQTIARISGLDPADPHFTGQPINRRLDASDAAFVDVIHTDASKYVLIAGYGTRDAVGSIDFYPNGGEHQPGCNEKPIVGQLSNITGLASSISCSHSRSKELFIESINSDCRFYGHKCPSSDSFENGQCLGCPTGGCPVMGYDADPTKTITGVFFLSTSGSSPYCGHEYFIEIHVSDSMLHTYGEFIVTLIGTRATSEPLKFESLMQSYNHGDVERHVISSHVNLGTVTSVKLEFIRATGLHGILASRYIKVHSVIVQPAESSVKTKICGHEHKIYSGHTVTMSSHSGC